MPGRSFEIRYPNGDFEIDASGQRPPPAVGETVRRNGRQWKVVRSTDGPPVVVQVEPAEEQRPTMLKLRFPDGDVEIRWTHNHPPVGTLVRSRGALWRVARDAGGVLFLETASADDQAQYGPVVKPSPLGEDAVLLETIVEA